MRNVQVELNFNFGVDGERQKALTVNYWAIVMGFERELKFILSKNPEKIIKRSWDAFLKGCPVNVFHPKFTFWLSSCPDISSSSKTLKSRSKIWSWRVKCFLEFFQSPFFLPQPNSLSSLHGRLSLKTSYKNELKFQHISRLTYSLSCLSRHQTIILSLDSTNINIIFIRFLVVVHPKQISLAVYLKRQTKRRNWCKNIRKNFY